MAAARVVPNLLQLTAGDWNGGDLSSLSGMTGLELLHLYGGLDSFAGVEELTGLREIAVYRGSASDLTPLVGLPALEHIELYELPIEDFSPLAALKSLRGLEVDPELRDAARAALPEGAELIS